MTSLPRESCFRLYTRRKPDFGYNSFPKVMVHKIFNRLNVVDFITNILIWLDSFPLLSQRTRTVHYYPDKIYWQWAKAPVLTAVSRVNFLFSFFHKKDISWVIIRIEIRMKSSALLPSNLPSVIDRSNLSPSRINLIGRWHSANY